MTKSKKFKIRYLQYKNVSPYYDCNGNLQTAITEYDEMTVAEYVEFFGEHLKRGASMRKLTKDKTKDVNDSPKAIHHLLTALNNAEFNIKRYGTKGVFELVVEVENEKL